MKKLIITSYTNVTNEGVVLHLNEKGRLKIGNILSKEFYVSWDKIGESLFENYCNLSDVESRRKIRNNNK